MADEGGPKNKYYEDRIHMLTKLLNVIGDFEEEYPEKSLYRSPENEFYVVDYASNPVNQAEQQKVKNQLNLYEP